MSANVAKRISAALKSNEGRTLRSNFIYLSLLKLVSFALPLVTMPYLTRVIGVDMFGAIAFAAAIMTIVETVTNWGFEYTATRDVAVNRENIGEVSQIYSQVLFSRFALTVLCFAGLWILIYSFESFARYKVLLMFTFLYIPGNILYPSWFFQAMEKMKFITFLDVLSKVVFTVLIFIVIRQESDYIYQPLLNACGFMVSGVIAQIIIFRKFKLRFIVPTVKSCIERLKNSTDMFISLILPNLYTNFSTIILRNYCGDAATGIYSGGQKLQNIVDQLTQVLSRTFFPFLARHKEKHHVYVMISGSIAVVASLILFFGADLFTKYLLAPEFADSATVMKIFAISPIFIFLMNTYGTNYLVIIKKENILRNIILTVSILGFALTLWLTPIYSYIGATVTVTTVWGVRGTLTYLYAKRESRKMEIAGNV